MTKHNDRRYPELFQEEYPVDGEHVSFIRERANKVLAYLLDHCATSFDDQKQILELALTETNARIWKRDNK